MVLNGKFYKTYEKEMNKQHKAIFICFVKYYLVLLVHLEVILKVLTYINIIIGIIYYSIGKVNG